MRASTGEKRPADRRWGRWVWVLAGLVLVWTVGRPALFLASVAWSDGSLDRKEFPGHANDASELESAPVHATWIAPAERDAALEGLRSWLARAEVENLAVSIAGARHSMGGHTIAEGGVVLDMTGFRSMQFDEAAGILRVGSGALWSDVLLYLDPLGRSVEIMQSNDSFSVGGSISVNCHGWQHGLPPIASSVRAFRILMADGELLDCSREENSELFGLALGGYGLFGVLIDIDLAVVPNELYAKTQAVIPTGELGERFLERARDPDVGLALGRVSIRPDALFEESIFKVLTRVESESLTPITVSTKRGLRRTIFRASVGSDYGKDLRWSLETKLGGILIGGETTRNSELSEPVDVYANSDPTGTDILHEYFVPHAELTRFLDAARPVFERGPCDLLNVTVRDIRRDEDTFLRYADQDMFGLVMLFHQKRTPEAEAEMRALTQDLIDIADSVGGRYYLTYRLHATREQFERAYPMAQEFFDAKRRYDPGERFQNRFYQTYGK